MPKIRSDFKYNNVTKESKNIRYGHSGGQKEKVIEHFKDKQSRVTQTGKAKTAKPEDVKDEDTKTEAE